MNIIKIKSQKVWGLVDCDSFFASCEIMRNPKIKDKPVCVGVDIVIAANYIAKSYNIKTGTPIWEARKIVNNLVVIPPDIAFYGNISNKIMDILKNYSNEIEIFSIDEAFIDITGKNVEFNMDYDRFVCMVQHDILKRVGIPVSIGVGKTKLISKIFASINKPFGNFICLDDGVIDNLFKLYRIGKIPFIGKKSEEKIRHKCKNIFEFKYLEYNEIRKHLKGTGLKIRFEINGINSLSLGNHSIPKSISRTKSFNPHFTNDKKVLFSYLMINFERAFEELTLNGLYTKSIKIILKDKQFNYYDLETILPNHTCNKNILVSHLKIMFNKLYNNKLYYRTTGIEFFDLRSSFCFQNSLLGLSSPNNEKLRNIINQINNKFGRFTISCANNINLKKKKNEYILNCK